MATIQQQTTQLEFHQAMADFKVMFPSMDDDVIEAVLRSNQGAVDSTIDQLLAMSMDNENEKIRQNLDQIEESELPSLPESNPPDISAAAAASETESASVAEASAAEGSEGDLNHGLGSPLHRQRGWAPPLLAPLPDDFLRLGSESLSKQFPMEHISYSEKVDSERKAALEDGNKRKFKEKSKLGYDFFMLSAIWLECELEDERIALFLQNEEFMAELRWNKDFLSMLDKDSPTEEQMGKIPQSRTSEDDALFKERLRNMGKMSRKKFSQLARVFTGRKKRSSSAKSILTAGPAPSRDNLLLQEDESDGT